MARAPSNSFIFWLRFVKVRLTPANYVCASNISRTNGQKNDQKINKLDGALAIN